MGDLGPNIQIMWEQPPVMLPILKENEAADAIFDIVSVIMCIYF